MLLFDLLVFCMTLYKAVVLPRPNGVNILDILFRDGELYLFTHELFQLNKYLRGDLFRVGFTFSFSFRLWTNARTG